MTRHRAFAWNVSLSLLLNLTLRATGAITFIFLSRSGWLAEAGSFSLALGYLAIFSTLFTGLDDFLVREYARSPATTKSLVVTYALVRAFLGLSLGLAVLSVIGWLSLHSPIEQWAIGIVLLSLLPEAIVATAQAVLTAQHRFGWPLAITVVGAIVRLGWVGGVWWANQDISRVVWAWPAGSFVMAGLALICFWPQRFEIGFEKRWIGPIIQAFPIFSGISLLSALEYQMDVILLSVLLTPADVAIYSSAAMIMGILLTFAQAYRMVIYPKLIQALTHQPKATGRLVVLSVLSMGALAGFAALVVFITASHLIRWIYGENLAMAVPVLRVLIWNTILAFINVPLVRFLMAGNGQTLIGRLLVVSLILNVGANFVLVPLYGPLGAAWARLLSSSVFCGLVGWAVWERLSHSVLEARI